MRKDGHLPQNLISVQFREPYHKSSRRALGTEPFIS